MAERRPLSIDADLDVTIAGQECRVWSEGDTLVVNAPSFRVARRLADGVEALESVPGLDGRLLGELVKADLVVELRVRRATVARIGSGITPGPLAGVVGVDGRVDLGGTLAAAWRRLL